MRAALLAVFLALPLGCATDPVTGESSVTVSGCRKTVDQATAVQLGCVLVPDKPDQLICTDTIAAAAAITKLLCQLGDPEPVPPKPEAQ